MDHRPRSRDRCIPSRIRRSCFSSSPARPADRERIRSGEDSDRVGQRHDQSAGNATIHDHDRNGTAAGAYVSATATDPSGNTSEFSADVPAQPEINLNVSASATPNPVASGGQLTYTISVTNSGTLAATGVMLSDQLPSKSPKSRRQLRQGTIEPQPGKQQRDGQPGYARRRGHGRH